METRQEREAKRRAHEAEIRKKLEEVNAQKDPNAPHKGRSSRQGVKLLYIRDYLRENTNKDHPKNAIEISKYLAGSSGWIFVRKGHSEQDTKHCKIDDHDSETDCNWLKGLSAEAHRQTQSVWAN